MQEFDNCDIISEVRANIVELLSPEKIILFHRKIKLSGQTESFKLCVVMDTDDKQTIEKKIYLSIDCEIPFDAIIYTPEEWTELIENPTTFAHKVHKTGLVIYE